MIYNGKQYAVVILKGNRFASCTGCPFNAAAEDLGCTAKLEGYQSCIELAHERKLDNKFSLTFREVNKHE